MADGPLIVQSDRTVLLEVAHPDAESARHELAVFAELERAPEHIHTYRITRLGLWNARAAGHTAEDMLDTLSRWTRFPVPASVTIDISETVNRYGRLVIERDAEGALVGGELDDPVDAGDLGFAADIGLDRQDAGARQQSGHQPWSPLSGTA